jgi:hypothetical protein
MARFPLALAALLVISVGRGRPWIVIADDDASTRLTQGEKYALSPGPIVTGCLVPSGDRSGRARVNERICSDLLNSIDSLRGL